MRVYRVAAEKERLTEELRFLLCELWNAREAKRRLPAPSVDVTDSQVGESLKLVSVTRLRIVHLYSGNRTTFSSVNK